MTLNMTSTTVDMKSIYCLLLFCTVAFAIPTYHQPMRRDAATDIDSPNVNQSSAQHPEQHDNATETLNVNLHRSAVVLSQPSNGTLKTTATTSSMTTTLSAREPSDGLSELQAPDDIAIDNTTLLIDYNQQDYRSSGEAPTATSVADERLAVINNTTRIALHLGEPRSLIDEKSSVGGDSGNDKDVTDISPVPASSLDATELRETDRSDATRLGQMRTKSVEFQSRDMRDARNVDKASLNHSEIFATLFKKKPYSKYLSAEQKWDDIFKRIMAIQGSVKTMMMKNFMRDIEYYADVSISQKCADDLRFIQNYASRSSNMRWLTHMFDSTGKSESGMLTGNLANLGHVIQCIKVRAPARVSNETFDERYFELQAATLGERFRGKYCLASVRPVLPEKPRLVSRFSHILEPGRLSNISFMGEPVSVLKQRSTDMSVFHESIDRAHNRLDQIPFESQLYEYLIQTRNFAFALPRFMGVCYPSSCSRDDIRYSIQKSFDDQHQVVDIEFECEVEESDPWEWFTAPRLVIYLLMALVVCVSFGASLLRHILVDRLQLKRRLGQMPAGGGGSGAKLSNLIATLDMLSMDKCAGILFIKTTPASPMIDKSKLENNRSTSIDALKGFLSMVLVYSELVHLGCLPVPFMWSKWSAAMFPFFRAYVTQIFLNTSVWTEAFYTISAYLISLKLLENYRPQMADLNGGGGDDDDDTNNCSGRRGQRRLPRVPRFSSFIIKRYIRLVLPMLAFMMFSYVWPRLSNGFVMQDQAAKILAPCDNHGWTNLLMFHNHYSINETCLWPTHVSASFFQLHLLSYPILLLLLLSLRWPSPAGCLSTSSSSAPQSSAAGKLLLQRLMGAAGLAAASLLATIGLVYPALRASNEELIVPFLIDYLDFDNYRRVIEWTVMPTHNHLTSYMLGIFLAYIVVRKRVQQEQATAITASGWHRSDVYLRHEGSLESMVSRSSSATTHQDAPNLRPTCALFGKEIAAQGGETAHRAHPLSSPVSSTNGSSSSSMRIAETSSLRDKCIYYRACVEVALVALLLASLTASFYWNGLGQPMSPSQTFWYMIGTKLCFNLAFGCLFYRHFAMRKNSTNPWMITRFLVPIGRMSLMLFYVSWPVIWFDLLASLYQWHPSHYFVFEKYNEIIFITLIISLLAYGAFEGTLKIVQYRSRAAKLDRWRRSRQSPSSSGFENLFRPSDWNDEQQQQQSSGLLTARTADGNKSARPNNQMFSKVSANTTTTPTGLSVPPSGHFAKTMGSPATPDSATGGRRRLSMADQYKLNAELRANYSFASIGLYESAGATDDLPSASQSAAPAGDPQVSPSPSQAGERQQ